MAEPVPPSQAFSAIPGLDAALGLRQSLGRETLYRSILGKFVSGHAQDVSALATALADGDMTTARRVAHTLKGVSAQIGAMDLRAVAERAELAITQGESEDVLAGLLAELEESLSALVAALAARLG